MRAGCNASIRRGTSASPGMGGQGGRVNPPPNRGDEAVPGALPPSDPNHARV